MKRNIILVAAAVLAAFLAGFIVARSVSRDTGDAHAEHKQDAGDQVYPEGTIWTCSMHPQVEMPKPGNCPICGMKLIPRETIAASRYPDIVLSPVERRFADLTVRMVGRVEYDESRVANIAAWIGGRIDRLYVDYTGITVRKGDHLAQIYSPDLLSAQQELLQAKAAIKELEKSTLDVIRDSARATLEASRDKLRLWGITPEKIAEVESTGKLITDFPIVAPIGGIVVEKMAKVGMYVQTGERIYTIADLSQVWVKLDAYETDLPWVRYGQKVTFAAQGLPGEEFTGTISFIDPMVDPRTRTVKVRVNVPNAHGKLKPDMFVHATLHSRVAADGRAMDPDLAGKWMCYMHPEVVKDRPGTCDVCGMPLVRTEDLGYSPAAAGDEARPLLVPASAPLLTGKRAIVYIRTGDDNAPKYEPRIVELGPRAGDFYIVKSGLADNELVVTQGNFKIDSQRQLEGVTPTMMRMETPPKPAPPATRAPPKRREVPVEFRRQLGVVWADYRALAAALAADDFPAARAASQKVRDSLAGVQMGLLEGDAHADWMRISASLFDAGKIMLDAKKIDDARLGFVVLSEALELAFRSFEIEPPGPVYRIHCPMAFNNRGADWLQDAKDVRNPYWGAQMLRCGEVVDVISEGSTPK